MQACCTEARLSICVMSMIKTTINLKHLFCVSMDLSHGYMFRHIVCPSTPLKASWPHEVKLYVLHVRPSPPCPLFVGTVHHSNADLASVIHSVAETEYGCHKAISGLVPTAGIQHIHYLLCQLLPRS